MAKAPPHSRSKLLTNLWLPHIGRPKIARRNVPLKRLTKSLQLLRQHRIRLTQKLNRFNRPKRLLRAQKGKRCMLRRHLPHGAVVTRSIASIIRHRSGTRLRTHTLNRSSHRSDHVPPRSTGLSTPNGGVKTQMTAMISPASTKCPRDCNQPTSTKPKLTRISPDTVRIHWIRDSEKSRRVF